MDLVVIAPGHRLAPAPAASAQRMFAAGCPAVITSTYRSPAEQRRLRDLYLAGKGAFALPPGKSLHERGQAVDWKRAAATWVRAHPEYGWRFTNPDEWWHTDYVLALDRTLHTLTPPAPIVEDDMPYSPDELGAIARKAALEAVMEAFASPQFRDEVRDAVLTAPLPPHPELTGLAATVQYAIRDTRIQTARIDKETP